jgi:hypothetical protein
MLFVVNLISHLLDAILACNPIDFVDLITGSIPLLSIIEDIEEIVGSIA